MIQDIFTEINEALGTKLDPEVLLEGGYVDDFCNTTMGPEFNYTGADIKTEKYLNHLLSEGFLGRQDLFPSVVTSTLLANNISEWFVCKHFSNFPVEVLSMVPITKKTIEYLGLSGIPGYVWGVISDNPFLDRDFLEEYMDQVKWDQVSHHIRLTTLTEDFIVDFGFLMDWNIISSRHDLTDEFMCSYSDRLNFEILELWYEDKFSREFLMAKRRVINWQVYGKPKGIELTEEDYIDIYKLDPKHIIPWVFEGLSCKFIRTNKELWDSDGGYGFGSLPLGVSLKKRLKYFLYCGIYIITKRCELIQKNKENKKLPGDSMN